MLILEPLTQFLIEGFRNNPSDTNTYYAQSKVYNALDGSLLATVNLTDNGNGYFSKLYTLPGDTYGNGRQITIITTFYTDSGYTTISPIYGATLEKYIIRHLASQNLGGFTTQLNEIAKQAAPDYEKIRQMVREELASLPKADVYDDSPLQERIDGLEATMNDGFIGHQAKIDESNGVMEAVKQSIEAFVAENQREHKLTRSALDPLPQSFDDISSRIDRHAQEDSALHGKTHELIAEVAGESPKRHAELMDALDRPINFQMTEGKVSRGTSPKPSKKDIEDEQRRITAEKLTRLIPQ